MVWIVTDGRQMTKATRRRDRWDLLLRGGHYWCLSVPLMVVRRLRIRSCRLRNDLPLAGGFIVRSIPESELVVMGKEIENRRWHKGRERKIYHDGRLLMQLKVGRATFLLCAQARSLRKITMNETERVGSR